MSICNYVDVKEKIHNSGFTRMSWLHVYTTLYDKYNLESEIRGWRIIDAKSLLHFLIINDAIV